MADDDEYAATEYCGDGADSEEDYKLCEDQGTSAARDNGPKIKVITKESLLTAQKDDLQRVMDLLSIKERHARTLLIYFRWDVQKLILVFVEKGADQLYYLAGIVLPKEWPLSVPVSTTVRCQICYEEIRLSEVAEMDCGHHFCKDCWIEYFIVQIKEGLSKRIRCMSHKCNTICSEEIIRNLVSSKDPHAAKMFDKFILESYVEDNNWVKWCPRVPPCGNAISVDGYDDCEVRCMCGLEFCFSCLSETHSPCSCHMWQLWVKKCQTDSESANWLTFNTKPCPKCLKPIYKDGGCNHIWCVYCGHSMCWICGAATGRNHTTTSIDGHNCGGYKAEDVQKTHARARTDIQRYTHYLGHYKAHQDSLKLESKLNKQIMERILNLEKTEEHRHKDYGWLLDGLNTLFRARRILSYSYPFAYYMFGDELFSCNKLFAKEMCEHKKGIKKRLFENQQQQFLEMVEKLSSALDEKIDEKPENIQGVQKRVVNLIKVTDFLCQQMYSCIENELLGPLGTGSLHSIAPYRSNG